MTAHDATGDRNRRGQAMLSASTRRRVIRETVAAMRKAERLALALFHYERIGPGGIARALEISPVEADRLLVSADARLRRALGQEEGRANGTDRRTAA